MLAKIIKLYVAVLSIVKTQDINPEFIVFVETRVGAVVDDNLPDKVWATLIFNDFSFADEHPILFNFLEQDDEWIRSIICVVLGYWGQISALEAKRDFFVLHCFLMTLVRAKHDLKLLLEVALLIVERISANTL